MIEMIPLVDLVGKPISGEWGDGEGDIKVLRTTNFTNEGYLRPDDVVSRSIDSKKVEQKKLIKGDIIIEKSGGSPTQPVGRVVYFEEDGLYLCNNFTSVLRAKNERVFPKYLHYMLFSAHKGGITQAFQNKTTGIINLKLNNYLEDLKIPLPPLATQKKIAAILDAADAHRQKTKQLLTKYDELAQSIFLEMFGDPVTNPKGWEVKRLDEVCDKITDGTHHSPESTSEGAPYVTAKHVKPFKLSFLSKPTYISWQDHEGIYKRCSPKKGDVLYIKDGATTGIACINTFEEEISLLSSLALIQTNRQLLNPDYLCFWLNYENMKAQLLSIWMSGAAIQRYTLKKIKSFEIMIPPIEIQERFSLIINANEKIKTVMNKEIKESENLFNSLLQKSFKGELVK